MWEPQVISTDCAPLIIDKSWKLARVDDGPLDTTRQTNHETKRKLQQLTTPKERFKGKKSGKKTLTLLLYLIIYRKQKNKLKDSCLGKRVNPTLLRYILGHQLLKCHPILFNSFATTL